MILIPSEEEKVNIGFKTSTLPKGYVLAWDYFQDVSKYADDVVSGPTCLCEWKE